MPSHFASSTRTSTSVLQQEIGLVSGNPLMTGLLRTVGGVLAVLDANRQILAVNDSFLELLGLEDQAGVLGLRPGEALHCLHADDEPTGCGTGRYCSSCGAAIAIVASLARDEPVERLCALTRHGEGLQPDLALQVRAHPLEIEGRRFLLLFLRDVTEEQQRFALERTFFHDINNLLVSMVGAAELLSEGDPDVNGIIRKSAMFLHSEIMVQQLLVDPEENKWQPDRHELTVETILAGVRFVFEGHPAARNRQVLFPSPSDHATLKTDQALVSRVLTNMVTNALEATPEGGNVRVWAESTPEQVTFRVWNAGHIPRQVALRVFQRNFSTKAEKGRGIGTFSMKLIGETILGGQVGFTSSPRTGTVFHLRLSRTRQGAEATG